MKSWHLFGLSASTLLLVVTAACVQPAARAQQSVNWASDFQAARAQARQTGKPLFVAFRCER